MTTDRGPKPDGGEYDPIRPKALTIRRKPGKVGSDEVEESHTWTVR